MPDCKDFPNPNASINHLIRPSKSNIARDSSVLHLFLMKNNPNRHRLLSFAPRFFPLLLLYRCRPASRYGRAHRY